MEMGLIAIGAGLAMGLSALATAIAQARIGAAAVGRWWKSLRRLAPS